MATKTWTDGFSADWSIAANWNPVGEPGIGDDVIIADVATQPVMDVNSNDLGSLVINAGATLNVNGRILTVSGNFTITATGSISNASGTIKFDGTTAITSNGIDLKDIEITEGSTLTLQGDLTVNDIVNNGTVNCNGFVLTINGSQSGSGSYVGCGGSPAPYSENQKRTRKLPLIIRDF